ncbi:hypothetical protein HK405_004497 [Cladochytrium tenue]|nr:hypothetical protein HK405_004497 [Cladochytrium tenue]
MFSPAWPNSGGGKPGDASSGGAPESSTPTATTAGPVRKPWYLEYDYKSEDIMFNKIGKLKGGKLPALVERLTLHDTVDSFYVQAFLLTYRSFTSTKELFELLKKRFNIQSPTVLNDLELEDWKNNKKKPICVRVFNVMKQWVEMYYQEDDEDKEVLQEMRAFASAKMQEEDARLASHLLKLIERREQGLMKKILVTSMGKDVPAPILPRNLKKLKFLDLDPLEIARQLTIIDSKVFNRIQPVEFLRKAWNDKANEVAVNVKTMIAMSNQVSGWVTQSILSENDHQKRKRLIVHFIAIAEKCRTLNNFNMLVAILGGLDTAPIRRLRRTWTVVPSKSSSGLEVLRETMGSANNFSRYRETLHSINPPCVPLLSLYLNDLTFIEDGSPNFLKPGGAAAQSATTSATGEPAPHQEQLVNFGKRMKTSEVIREVQQFQSAPYLFTQVPELQEFLRESFAETVDETDLYNLSLSLEPREYEANTHTTLMKVLVIGAGVAGPLVALALKRAGHDVEIFDRVKPPAAATAEGSRPIWLPGDISGGTMPVKSNFVGYIGISEHSTDIGLDSKAQTFQLDNASGRSTWIARSSDSRVLWCIFETKPGDIAQNDAWNSVEDLSSAFALFEEHHFLEALKSPRTDFV